MLTYASYLKVFSLLRLRPLRQFKVQDHHLLVAEEALIRLAIGKDGRYLSY
jgi:hypothetical protein